MGGAGLYDPELKGGRGHRAGLSRSLGLQERAFRNGLRNTELG